jgi:hypothetical protein
MPHSEHTARKTLQICLVSSQLQPNVIPWLELKPDATLLLASEAVESEARQLLKIAHGSGLSAQRHPTAVPTDSYAGLREYFLDVATSLPRDCDISINLTGGTKLMTLAAADVLADEGYRFFYTDTQNQRIEFLNLSNTGSTQPHRVFSTPMKLDQMIACGMAEISTTGSKDPQDRQKLLARKSLTENFTRGAINNRHCMSDLNRRISMQVFTNNGQSLKQNTLKLNQTEERAFRNIFDNAQHSGAMQYSTDTATIHFRDAEEARWLNGLWLEEFVWWQMQAAELQHYEQGVQLQWELPNYRAKQALANEIDVIAAQNNRLCIVECKTGKLEEEGKQDILHKLTSVTTQLAGPFGIALLASLHAPSDSLADRAHHSNVAIVCGQHLLNIKRIFTDWKELH